MYLVNEWLFKYEKRMFDQGEKITYDFETSRQSFIGRYQKVKHFYKGIALECAVRIERIFMLAIISVTLTLSAFLFPAALILSPSLLCKSNKVSKFVRIFFKFFLHELKILGVLLGSICISTRVANTESQRKKFGWLTNLRTATRPILDENLLRKEIEIELHKIEALENRTVIENQKVQSFNEFINSNTQKEIHVKLQHIGSGHQEGMKILNIIQDLFRKTHKASVEIIKENISFEEIRNRFIEKNRGFGNPHVFKQYQNIIEDKFPRRADGKTSYDVETALWLLSDVIRDKYIQNEALFASTLENIHTKDGATVDGDLFLQAKIGLLGCCKNKSNSSSGRIKDIMVMAQYHFGLIKGLTDCQHEKCVMNQKNNKARSIIYCPQHMAWIAYLSKISLLDQYKAFYLFLDTFKKSFKMDCNLNEDKKTVQKNIYALI